MSTGPKVLTPEVLNDYLERFSEEGSGLTVPEILDLYSHLIHTGSIRFTSPDMQEIAGSFISGGALDFEGNILMTEDDIRGQGTQA